MPGIRLTVVSDDNNERFEVRGAVRGTVDSIENLQAIVLEETPLSIGGLPEGPLPVFTATIKNAASELVVATSDTDIEAEVKDQFGNLVDATYDVDNWTWAIDSDTTGGASFGSGANADDLTVGSSPGTVVISATHIETDAVATATISVVSAIVLTYVLEGLPAEVETGESYPMTARVLNADGSENEAYIPANWTFSITAGGANGSITGTNSDVLSVNSGASGSITVEALHSSSNSDDETVTVIDAAGAFPEGLEPAGATEILANQGDTTNFGTGWVEELDWSDTGTLAVVSDGSSKFGSVLEKSASIGDSGWLDARNRGNNVANHREIYIRHVFLLSANWERATEEAVFQYGRKVPGEAPDQFELILKPSTPGIQWRNYLTGSDAGDASRNGTFEVETPNISALSRDAYHTLELRHRLNTDGNADGYLRVAVDGTEITSWNILGGASGVDIRSGVEWASTAGSWTALRFTGLIVFHKWRGGTKSVNDSVRLSELFISGLNT